VVSRKERIQNTEICNLSTIEKTVQGKFRETGGVRKKCTF